MNLKNIVMTTAVIIFSTAMPVLANNPPGPAMLLAEVLILPAMIILSVIGGAYVVLNRTQRKKSWVPLIILAIIVIVLSGAHEGLGALVAFFFGVIALKRGIQMITWGFQARFSREKKEYLADRTPWRLVPAGVVLIAVTIFLVGLSMVFFGYYPSFGQADRESNLKDFVAYKLAYARWEINNNGKTSYRALPEEKNYNFKRFPSSSSFVQIEYSKDGKHFTVYMLPYKLFPFPYNYFTSQPSYRVDETGQIRMVMVHKIDKKCPSDAPMVMQVSELDVKKMLRKIEERKQAEEKTLRLKPKKT
jgi:hypothetical protein